LEQRNFNPNHKLGGRVIDLISGAASFSVKMRDHEAQTFVSAKEKIIPVRFPIKLSPIFEDQSTKLQGLIARGPIRLLMGVGDPNTTGTTDVQKRHIFLNADWSESFNGNIVQDSETLMKIAGPVTDVTTGNAPTILFGAVKTSSTDTNTNAGPICYGTVNGVGETLLFAHEDIYQSNIFRLLYRGDYYAASQKYPMWDATYNGAEIPAGSTVDPYTLKYSYKLYDDFGQLVQTTGIVTATHTGVYNVTGAVTFKGDASAFNDIIRLRFKRVRGGVTTYYGVTEALLEGTNADARQTIYAHAKVGLLVGDTLSFEIEGWFYPLNTNSLTYAYFSGNLIRGV
jgi:hypothetical protein